MRWQIKWLLMLALAFLCPPLMAQEDKDTEENRVEEKQEQDEPTLLDRFREYQVEHRKMMRELGQKFRSAESNEDRAEIMDQRLEIEAELGEKILKLASEADDPEQAVSLLVFVATNLSGEAKGKATNILLEDHIESEAIATMAASLGRGSPSPTNEAMLRKILSKSSDATVKGNATFALTRLFGTLKRISEMDEGTKKQVAASLGEGGTEFLEKWNAEAIEKELVGLLETCISEYADIEIGRRKLGDIAEGQLFVIKYLAIGKEAPDIEGQDLDEVAFRLSDYRGKVVVLDFWGDW